MIHGPELTNPFVACFLQLDAQLVHGLCIRVDHPGPNTQASIFLATLDDPGRLRLLGLGKQLYYETAREDFCGPADRYVNEALDLSTTILFDALDYAVDEPTGDGREEFGL